jgi:aldose sugar dehydrogenase
MPSCYRRACAAAVILAAPFIVFAAQPRDPAQLATELCAGCHGANLTGGTAPNLLDAEWKNGRSDEAILRGIREGFPMTGMAGFGAVLSEAEQNALLAYLRKQGRHYAEGLIPVPPPPADRISLQSEHHRFRLETVAAPLDTPWGVEFLPDGKILVTERIGRLRVIADGKLLPDPIRDTPKPLVRQDGGLLDVIAHPKYAENGWIYLAYTEAGTAPSTTNTIVVRGRIRDGAWVDQQEIFRAPPEFYYVDYSHYGCRFLWDRDGHLFFTIGERGKATDAQDLTNPLGKIHRVHDDGTIPRDNPFVNRPGAWPSIWSYGNRHVQGLQFHPVTGKLWATEHGPRGGDELNRIEPGRNYGWPVISFGAAYGKEVIEGTQRAGMEQPVAWWSPSIAPAAIEFYTGDRFPKWKNSLFMACLVGQHLRRIETDGDKVVHQEVIFSQLGRVRDVVQGPDGYLYVVLNNPGRLSRIVPEE